MTLYYFQDAESYTTTTVETNFPDVTNATVGMAQKVSASGLTTNPKGN
jgi:hypothetical protein